VAELVVGEGGEIAGGTWDRVVVDTDDPVALRGLTVQGTGDLVTAAPGRQVALVLDSVTLRGDGNGRAVSVERPRSLVVQGCAVERHGGIRVLGAASGEARISVRGSVGRDLYGRDAFAQFVQLDKVQGVHHVEIIGNRVDNAPGRSRVEDVISIYESSGTPGSPIRVARNVITGAHPLPGEGGAYSGGGIMCGDGEAGDSRYVLVERNEVRDSANHGIAIASGRDIVVRNNLVTADGLAGAIGLYVWNIYGHEGFGGHRVEGNRVRVRLPGGGRNDLWFPDAADQAERNELLP